MLYFSELKGISVTTTNKDFLGKLEDMIFNIADSPQVTKLVVRSKDGVFTIAIENVKSLHNEIIVDSHNGVSTLEENELYIGKNLLDKQIIDLVGNKMVRVNDVVLLERSRPEGYSLFVTGVDIGILGIFRRINIEDLFQKILSLLYSS